MSVEVEPDLFYAIIFFNRTCSWGELTSEVPDPDENKENDNTERPEGEEEEPKEKEIIKEYDFIVSGAIHHGSDNPEVKVWRVENNSTFSHLYSLTGHSLGIVSVDVSPNGKCEHLLFDSIYFNYFHHRYCKQFPRLDALHLELIGWKTSKSGRLGSCRSLDCYILTRQQFRHFWLERWENFNV